MSISVEGLKYEITKLSPNTDDLILIKFSRRDGTRMKVEDLEGWRKAFKELKLNTSIVMYVDYPEYSISAKVVKGAGKIVEEL